jgi:hypothetical protein
VALPVTLYLGGELSVRAIASQWSAIYNLKVTRTRIEAVGMQQRRLSTGADGRNVAEELESPAWVSTLLDSGPDGCGPSCSMVASRRLGILLAFGAWSRT